MSNFIFSVSDFPVSLHKQTSVQQWSTTISRDYFLVEISTLPCGCEMIDSQSEHSVGADTMKRQWNWNTDKTEWMPHGGCDRLSVSGAVKASNTNQELITVLNRVFALKVGKLHRATCSWNHTWSYKIPIALLNLGTFLTFSFSLTLLLMPFWFTLDSVEPIDVKYIPPSKPVIWSGARAIKVC